MQMHPRSALICFFVLGISVWSSDAMLPLTLPDGATREVRAGWEALIKNDFAAAEQNFKQALEGAPRDLNALEGLRWTYTSLGRYKDAQGVNFKMVRAAAKEPYCHSFIFRCVEALPYVECRAQLLSEFEQALADASPQVALHLRDQMSQIHYRAGRYDEGRKLLEGLGYVGNWVFAAGPFGEKDRNNTIEKRFAPERALKSLEFKGDKDAQVKVERDPKNLDRDLDLDVLFEGTRGVYYVMANLKSDADRDVILSLGAPQPYRLFLRGMLVASQSDDELFGRLAGQLLHVRLIKGSNPLLFKLGALGSLSVRVAGLDFGPVPGVEAAGMSGEELAAHETSSVRGYVMGEKFTGAAAAWFLEHFGKNPNDIGALRAVVESAPLTLPEAVWLQLVLLRENDHATNEILARRLMQSFPDSVAVLDLGASILGSAGRALGNNEARENEEARRIRERALKIVPTSHQHLIALADFFANNDLRDQSFELIKKCADAHPDSAFAQAELGRQYEARNFQVLAERCFENAARLDESQIPLLANYEQSHGSRARARELIDKQRQLGMLSADAQYNEALRREDFVEAKRLLALDDKWFPERREHISASRAQLLQAQGDLQGAYDILKHIYDARAGNPARDRQLPPLVDLALRLGRASEAQALLAAHLAKHPNDLEARRRLADLDSSDDKHWWEAYDVNIADIDTSHFSSANYPSANHAWIVDLMVVRVLPDMSTESYTHIAQKVLNLKGIGELSEVMTRARSQDIVYIRTLNPDGQSYMPQNVHDFHLEQSASLYKVGPGSILERAYVEQTPADENEPRLGLGFNFNAIEAPRAVSRWVVLLPDALKDKVDIQSIRPELLEEKTLPGPKGYTVHQWTNKRIEGIKGERFMPREADREIIPLVSIETKNNPVRANVVLMRREFDRIPDAAQARARDIAKVAGLEPAAKGREQEAQFKAIVLWVRDNIETGTDSRTFDDVWHSRKGSPAQMLVLAREMARAAGLPVNSAYLNGNYLPGKVWVTKNAKRPWEPAQFTSFGTGGQMLVLSPSRGYDVWAQYSGAQRVRFYSPFDLLPSQAGALALLLGDNGARVRRVQGDRMGQSQFREDTKVNLAPDGAATVHTEFQLYGAQAGAIREALSNPQQRDPLRDSVTRRTWPHIKPLAYEWIGETEVGQTLLIKFSGRLSPLAEQAGGALYLQAFPDAPRITSLRGQSEHESDIVIKDDGLFSEFDRAVVYTAPEGFAWSEIPDNIFICNEFGFYMADFTVKGRTLSCTRACLVPAQRIAPEKYAEFQDYLAQVARHFSKRIACAPLKVESFGNHKKEIFSAGYAASKEE